MAADPVLKVPCASSTNCDQLRADDNTVEVAFDTTTKLLRVGNRAGVRTLASLDGTETFTNKTLTAPTITAGTFTGDPSGIVRIAGGVITEATADGTYSISVTIPAASVLLDLIITQQVVWGAGTSATLIVGDSADPDGFFTGINAKTTPAAGTSLRADTVPGGTGDGAYLGDTNGEFVGPALTNWGRVYTASSVITATITKSGAGTTGRTWFHVVYATPTVVATVYAA